MAENLKIVQMNTVFFKTDAISNVALALEKIHKEQVWESHLIADLFSDYTNVLVFAGKDYDKTPPMQQIIYLFSRFIRLSNKKIWLKKYLDTYKYYKPQVAKKLIENADIRIWHYGAFYTLFRYFHRGDILFYYGITDPFLSYFSELSLFSKNMLQATLDLKPFVIAESEFIKQSLIELGFNKDSINVLPLFHTYNISYKIHKHIEPQLLTWGRYAANKAIPELVKFANENRIKLRVFGDNFQVFEYSDQYQEALKNNSLDYAELSGKVPDFEKELNGANIYICNSYHEGFNMPLIEAEAHSLPVLARRGTAMDELIKDGYNGYLFNDLAEVPALIAKIKAHYKTFSYNAWQHSQKYTFDKFKHKYLSIINKYITNKRQSYEEAE